MAYYARIKSYNGKLNDNIKEGVWYEIEYLKMAEGHRGGIVFKIPKNDWVEFCFEFDSYHLNGGDWEIVEGVKVPFEMDIGTACKTQCAHNSNRVFSYACQQCEHFIDKCFLDRTVICGHPQNKEIKVDVYEALAKAKYGERCCRTADLGKTCEEEYIITKGDRTPKILSDRGETVFNNDKDWVILPPKGVSVTIDGEQFEISKESAKSFKESINNVKL